VHFGKQHLIQIAYLFAVLASLIQPTHAQSRDCVDGVPSVIEIAKISSLDSFHAPLLFRIIAKNQDGVPVRNVPILVRAPQSGASISWDYAQNLTSYITSSPVDLSHEMSVNTGVGCEVRLSGNPSGLAGEFEITASSPSLPNVASALIRASTQVGDGSGFEFDINRNNSNEKLFYKKFSSGNIELGNIRTVIVDPIIRWEVLGNIPLKIAVTATDRLSVVFLGNTQETSLTTDFKGNVVVPPLLVSGKGGRVNVYGILANGRSALLGFIQIVSAAQFSGFTKNADNGAITSSFRYGETVSVFGTISYPDTQPDDFPPLSSAAIAFFSQIPSSLHILSAPTFYATQFGGFYAEFLRKPEGNGYQEVHIGPTTFPTASCNTCLPTIVNIDGKLAQAKGDSAPFGTATYRLKPLKNSPALVAEETMLQIDVKPGAVAESIGLKASFGFLRPCAITATGSLRDKDSLPGLGGFAVSALFDVDLSACPVGLDLPIRNDSRLAGNFVTQIQRPDLSESVVRFYLLTADRLGPILATRTTQSGYAELELNEYLASWSRSTGVRVLVTVSDVPQSHVVPVSPSALILLAAVLGLISAVSILRRQK
jgi:hypothetical protein